MKLISRTMPRNYTAVINACNHFGANTCRKDLIQAMVARIADDPECFYLNLGDNIDGITPGDRRCKIREIDPDLTTPQLQAEAFIETFTPIREKILAIGVGNHEHTLLNTADFGEIIANGLGVPYGTYTYKFIAKDAYDNIVHKYFLTHGDATLSRAGTEPDERKMFAGRSLRKVLLETHHSDCVVMAMAHTHRALVKEPTTPEKRYLIDNGERLIPFTRTNENQAACYIPEDSRYYLCAPSMMDLYADLNTTQIPYGEKAGYSPPELGWLEVRVERNRVVGAKKVILN